MGNNVQTKITLRIVLVYFLCKYVEHVHLIFVLIVKSDLIVMQYN